MRQTWSSRRGAIIQSCPRPRGGVSGRQLENALSECSDFSLRIVVIGAGAAKETCSRQTWRCAVARAQQWASLSPSTAPRRTVTVQSLVHRAWTPGLKPCSRAVLWELGWGGCGGAFQKRKRIVDPHVRRCPAPAVSDGHPWRVLAVPRAGEHRDQREQCLWAGSWRVWKTTWSHLVKPK